MSTLGASYLLLPNAVRAEEGTTYQLPSLSYQFHALEPHIDAQTMAIHLDKHHAAYISNLNTALATAPDLAKQPLETILANLPAVADESLRNTIRNNGGGHWNHDFFWKTLAPASKSGAPSSELTAAIDSTFGSMDGLKKAFGEAATKRFGSGWAWLILQDGKLKITSTANQDNPVMKGIVPDADLGKPILALDVWEHAYYLRYQNRRPDYIAAWWNVVNWRAASERFSTR
ncbi:MAG: superoxide dismutase [Akkermansiaceae bacterium]|nr:superoxide dismutase [Akkermansiaceae bacterium]